MTIVDSAFSVAATMVCGPTIGFVLAAATWHKLAEPDRFRLSIVDYRIVPSAAAPHVARLLVAVEGLLAAMLLVLPSVREAGLAAAGLLVLYTAAIGVNLLRGRSDLDCGCGFEPAPIGLGKIATNLALVAMALAAALAPPPGGVLVWISVHLVALNAVVSTVVLSVLWRTAKRSAAISGAAP